MRRDASKFSPRFEIASVLVRFNHIAPFVVNANHGMVGTTEPAGASSASG